MTPLEMLVELVEATVKYQQVVGTEAKCLDDALQLRQEWMKSFDPVEVGTALRVRVNEAVMRLNIAIEMHNL